MRPRARMIRPCAADRSYEAVTVGECDGLGPAVGAEFGKDVLEMVSDRLGADPQLEGDYGLRPATREQCEHFALAPRQGRPPKSRLGLRHGVGQEPSHAGEQLSWVERLCEIIVAADIEPGDAVIRLDPIAGDEDDGDSVAELGLQLPADLVARKKRKADVEDHEVGVRAASFV